MALPARSGGTILAHQPNPMRCLTHPVHVTSALLLTLALLTPPAAAHGGNYRGPGSVVPPASNSGSGGAGTAGAPAGPAAPGTAGAPSAPGQAGPPGTGSAGPTGPGATAVKGGARGAALEPDLGRWQYWWEFNKDEVLALRRTLADQAGRRGLDDALLGTAPPKDLNQRRPPNRTDIDERIRPALLAVLANEEQRDLVSGAMVALAKVSRGEPEVRDQFLRRLLSRDQEIRETAALALGIAGNSDAFPELAELFADRDRGRTLVDRSAVDNRTRAFAGYALGLIAHASDDPQVKLRVYTTLAPALSPDAALDRNVRVAAVLAVRMLDLDARDARERSLRDEAVTALRAYFRAPLGAGEEWQQAHAPLAMARLLGRGDSPLHQEVKAELMAELKAQRRRGDPILQSSALALGLLALPPEAQPADAAVSDLLRKVMADAKDWQVRVYALEALGQIGGASNRAVLLDRLARSRQLEQAWAAMALGFAARAADQPDPEAGNLMLRGLQDVKDPEVRGAFAVALGLVQHRDAVDTLRKMMRDYQHQDELCGYLCIGLSLLGDQASVPALQGIVAQSMRRPELLKQAAVALGRLGDHRSIGQLRDALVGEDLSVARMGAAAAALAQIGDRRCLDPLLEILNDPKQIPLSRAFAAVALGGMGDKSPLPWNASIGRDLNYRAAVETLTSSGAGVLEIF